MNTSEEILDRIRLLPDQWRDQALERYNERRKAPEGDITWEDGYSAGWDHAATVLEQALQTLRVEDVPLPGDRLRNALEAAQEAADRPYDGT